MRIRRRPQASDPGTSASPAQTPQNAARNRDDDDDDADLGRRKSGAARRLALPPQDNAVNSAGVGAGAGQGAGGGDAHMRCRSSVENGHRSWDQNEDSMRCTGAVGSEPELPTPVNVEENASSNGMVLPMAPAVAAAVKDEKKVSNGITAGGGGAANNKKRRGPAVLLEGSRCSRVNGRGWRCSQPTLVGYSLCEHHLGKGRARSAAAGGAVRSGPGQLGRTEHRPRALLPAPAAGAVTIAAAPPNAEALPGLPGC